MKHFKMFYYSHITNHEIFENSHLTVWNKMT